MYDASGSILFAFPLPQQSYKRLVDSMRAHPSPCTPTMAALAGTKATAGNLAAALPTTGSMQQLVQQAQARAGVTVVRQGTSERYKITMPHDSAALGFRFNTEATRIEAYVNAASAQNVIESIHSFNGSTLKHSTYFVPRAFGLCTPEYKTIVNVSYYTTPSNVAMMFVSQTDIEQMTINNYIR